MTMPFGKFKGVEIEELPCWYLKYIAENFDEERATLLDAARTEIRFRRTNRLTIKEVGTAYLNA